MLQECVDNCMKICTCAGAEEADNPVVVLRKDGQVLEFPRRIRCSEVLAANPHYRICHASSLLLKQKGRILSNAAMLEPGEIYFLVPQPGTPAAGKGADSSMHFMIPKEYLEKIAGDFANSANSANAGRSAAARRRVKKAAAKVQGLKRSRSKSNFVSSIDSSMQFVVPKDILSKSGEEAASAAPASGSEPAAVPKARPVLTRSPSMGKSRPQIRLKRNRRVWVPPLDTIVEGSSGRSSLASRGHSRSSGRSFEASSSRDPHGNGASLRALDEPLREDEDVALAPGSSQS